MSATTTAKGKTRTVVFLQFSSNMDAVCLSSCYIGTYVDTRNKVLAGKWHAVLNNKSDI